MKKIFIILSLLLPFTLTAGNVSEERALDVAKRFFSVTDTKAASSLHLVWTGTDTDTKGAAEEPLFYVFTREKGGFVIIAGHDSMHPVIAYSDSNPFMVEGMPDDIRFWFSQFARAVRYAREKGLKATPRIASEWNSVRPLSETAAGKLLITAEWNQDEPYNIFCPEKDGRQAYTGCVPTAAAIIMRYHEWPDAGTGTLPSYSSFFDGNSYTENEIELGHSYDWGNMPLRFDYEWVNNGGNWERQFTNSREEMEAVATLMHEIGVAFLVAYGFDGTSGYFQADKLVEHFGYDAGYQKLERNGYTSGEWFSIIKKEIDSNRPVAYSGHGEGYGSGHQFVADGYDSEGLVHLNLGWGGYCTAYYQLDCLDPGGNDFNYLQEIVTGIQKNAGGSPRPELFIDSSGISLTEGVIGRGSTFTMKVDYAFSASSTPFQGRTKLVLVDKNGNIKEDISDIKDWHSNPWKPYVIKTLSYECELKSEPEVGDYISMVYADDSEWSMARMYGSSTTIFRYAAVEGAMIDVKPSYKAGDRFWFNLVNLQSVPQVTWYFDGEKAFSESIILSQGTHTVKAYLSYSDGTRETIVQQITVK